MNSGTAAKAVEGWDLSEVLAAFRQVAREAQCAPQPAESDGSARRLTPADDGESRR
ncbi:MAG TPA: hypothetical protein VLC73_07505 [Burkholderiales bacterium]|nr:hypothetical protein [Burkholderiales bacterium]